MPAGKLAAQAGHAFLDSFLKSSTDIQREYLAPSHGTKVTLAAKTLEHLLRARDECARIGLPHALITDSGHVLPPHFDGNPIITALGIGPARRGDVHAITQRFQLI